MPLHTIPYAATVMAFLHPIPNNPATTTNTSMFPKSQDLKHENTHLPDKTMSPEQWKRDNGTIGTRIPVQALYTHICTLCPQTLFQLVRPF